MLLSLISLIPIFIASSFNRETLRAGSIVSLPGLKDASLKNRVAVIIGEAAADEKGVMRYPVAVMKGDYYDNSAALDLKKVRVPAAAVADVDWEDETQIRYQTLDIGFTINGAPLTLPKDASFNAQDLRVMRRLIDAVTPPSPFERKLFFKGEFLDRGDQEYGVRLVGAVLNQLFGMNGMVKAYDMQREARGFNFAECLSRAWDQVGDFWA